MTNTKMINTNTDTIQTFDSERYEQAVEQIRSFFDQPAQQHLFSYLTMFTPLVSPDFIRCAGVFKIAIDLSTDAAMGEDEDYNAPMLEAVNDLVDVGVFLKTEDATEDGTEDSVTVRVIPLYLILLSIALKDHESTARLPPDPNTFRLIAEQSLQHMHSLSPTTNPNN